MKVLKAIRRVGGRDTDIEIPYSGSEEGDSFPSTWVGPFPFTAVEYNDDLGSGWDGILVNLLGYTLPIGSMILGTAVVITESFSELSGGQRIYCGTLAGNDFSISDAIPLENSADPNALFVGTPNVNGVVGVLIDDFVTQVWVDDFSVAPTVGAANLYINVTAPISPS